MLGLPTTVAAARSRSGEAVRVVEKDPLDVMTDELMSIIDDAEDFFAGRHRGVAAGVQIPEGNGCASFRLRWAKSGNLWTLLADDIALTDATRAVRVAAASHFEKLLSALEAEESGLEHRLKEAIGRARRFMSERPAQPSSQPQDKK